MFSNFRLRVLMFLIVALISKKHALGDEEFWPEEVEQRAPIGSQNDVHFKFRPGFGKYKRKISNGFDDWLQTS